MSFRGSKASAPGSPSRTFFDLELSGDDATLYLDNNKVTDVVKTTGNMWIKGTLTQGSDRRLKEHIACLGSEAEEFVRKLMPAFYTKDGERHVGFYAQDIEGIDPWKCMVDEKDGYMTLGYTELIAPLVAYCQSLERRIEQLEKGE
jgi:hypothetical protein